MMKEINCFDGTNYIKQINLALIVFYLTYIKFPWDANTSNILRKIEQSFGHKLLTQLMDEIDCCLNVL